MCEIFTHMLEWYLSNVMSVAKALLRAHTSLHIRWSVLEKSHINVCAKVFSQNSYLAKLSYWRCNIMNVTKSLVKIHTLFIIREFILERKLTSVMSVAVCIQCAFRPKLTPAVHTGSRSYSVMNRARFVAGVHTLASWENRYWRKAIQMYWMWQGLQKMVRPQVSSKNSFWRETAQMPWVWQSLYLGLTSHQSSDILYWQENLQMYCLWQGF